MEDRWFGLGDRGRFRAKETKTLNTHDDNKLTANVAIVWRMLGLAAMPFTMFVSWCLRSSLWYGLPAWWFMLANPAAILITLVSLGMLFRNNDKTYLNLCLVTFAGLIVVSLLPVWFQHVGEPGETESHWHNYWSMSHIH